MNKNFYEEEEDTYLLCNVLSKYLESPSLDEISNSKLSILEVGVGNGYTISFLEKQFPLNNYLGTDINPDAIEESRKKTKNATLKQGNLLEPFKKLFFDIIYFNTPYLPCESSESLEELELIDRAIYGGKKGYETILGFLEQAKNQLKSEGRIFMLCSSLSKPHVINEYLQKNLLEYSVIEKKNVFFEELLVYEISLNPHVKELVKKDISKLTYLSKGKHSTVLEGIFKSENVVCKIERGNYVGKEGFFLEKLQNYSFAPKLFFYTQNYIVMEKIDGTILDDIYNKKYSSQELTIIFNNILEATQKLDELGLQKFEMLNPYKHIFILDNLQIKFIDFERMIYSKKPKNTTQFLEYLRRKQKKLEKIGVLIDENKIASISRLIKSHKQKITLENISK